MTVDQEDSNKRLKGLMDMEEAAWGEVLKTDLGPEGPSYKKSEVFRQWWFCASAVLRFFRASHNLGVKLELIPDALLQRLSILADDLSSGHSFSLANEASLDGQAYRAGERRDIWIAVLYKNAVARGQINDRRSTKTVSEAYGVEEETVRGWVKKQNKIYTLLDSLDLEPDPPIDELRPLLEATGKRYQKARMRKRSKLSTPPND